MAESDRDVYRRDCAALEREKVIMKDVPGWEVSSSSRLLMPRVFMIQCLTVYFDSRLERRSTIQRGTHLAPSLLFRFEVETRGFCSIGFQRRPATVAVITGEFAGNSPVPPSLDFEQPRSSCLDYWSSVA